MDSIWTLFQKEALSLLHWTVNKPPFAMGGFTMFSFQGYMLFKHPWKDSLEQSSQCLCLQKWQRPWRDVSQHIWWFKLDNNICASLLMPKKKKSGDKWSRACLVVQWHHQVLVPFCLSLAFIHKLSASWWQHGWYTLPIISTFKTGRRWKGQHLNQESQKLS